MNQNINCNLCPRECGADRLQKNGFCGGGVEIRIARAALHFWEEPCISGTQGSGTVFFSGCPLKCCFCQNHAISAENFGENISPSRLAEIFEELEEQGAHNINLVTPTHYLEQLLPVLEQVKPKLNIPIVYNTSAYEHPESVKRLEGLVDIYLPDFKFWDAGLAGRYAKAEDYPRYAKAAILEMFRQTGPYRMRDGLLTRGTLIRHLILPGGYRDSLKIIDWIAEQFSGKDILISLMSQYTPCCQNADFPELNRRITTYEYQKVLDRVLEYQLNGYMQERRSAREKYTPSFNLEGVRKKSETGTQ